MFNNKQHECVHVRYFQAGSTAWPQQLRQQSRSPPGRKDSCRSENSKTKQKGERDIDSLSGVRVRVRVRVTVGYKRD